MRSDGTRNSPHNGSCSAAGHRARLKTGNGSMKQAPRKFLTDERGERVGVILDMDEYRRILDALEELESILAYDAAKASGEQPIPLQQAIDEIETSR